MTTKYLYFDPATGRVTHETGDVDLQAKLPFVEATGDTPMGLTHHVVNGLLVSHGPQPSPHHDFNYMTKKWVPNGTQAWAAVRVKRDQFLKDADFTQLADSPKNKQQWATYRQALRDVTQQGDAWAIVWPVEPT